MRDLGGSPRSLAAAAATLEARADRANALQARLIAARRLLLLGRLDEAAAALARLDARGLPPSLAAVAELTAAELALRSLRIGRGAGGARPRARGGRSRTRAGAPGRGGGGACCARSSRRPAPLRRRRAGAAPRRGRSASGLGRAGRRRLPSRAARRRRVAAAGAPAGAVRVGARARRGVAWRCRSASLDRVRVRRPPPQRVASSAPAGRDRPSARARCSAGAHRGHRARLRPQAARRARRRRAGAAHRRRSGVAGGARSPTARPGRPRRWRWPWGPVSAPSSARSSSSRPPDGCARSGGRGRVAGCRRRWRDSRRSCYSPPRSRSSRVGPAAPIRGAPLGAKR